MFLLQATLRYGRGGVEQADRSVVVADEEIAAVGRDARRDDARTVRIVARGDDLLHRARHAVEPDDRLVGAIHVDRRPILRTCDLLGLVSADAEPGFQGDDGVAPMADFSTTEELGAGVPRIDQRSCSVAPDRRETAG